MPIAIARRGAVQRPINWWGLNRNSPQADGLVFWWLGASRYGRNEAGIGPQYHALNGTPAIAADGEVGLHYTFSTAEIYWEFANYTAANLGASGDAITVTCWLKHDSNNNHRNMCAMGRTSGGGNGQYVFRLSNTDKLEFYWNDGSWRVHSTTPSIAINRWVHVACRHIYGTSGVLEFYVDGKLVAGTSGSNTLPSTLGGELWVGDVNAGNEDFVGELHDVRVYNRYLPVPAIQAMSVPDTRWDLWLGPPIPIIVPEQAVAGDVVTPNDCTHSHTADQITITQIHNLQINEASHAHTADNITLTQVHNLQIAECTHGHTADSLTLTQVHTVTPADCLHAHTADSLTLTQIHNLVISECTHGHTADNIVIGQIHNLVISECLHAHTADNITITEVAAGDVVPDATTHAHTADNIVLGQIHNLQLDAATHGHTADSLVLVQVHNLIISECLHAHTADNITITQVVGGAVVTPDDSDHGHTADNIVLTQIHNLIISECLHAHVADNATVQLAGIPTQPGMEFTSRGRRQHYTLYGRQHYTLRED